MAAKPKIFEKTSNNPLRCKRLKGDMDELHYLNRVISEFLRPLRTRKEGIVARIREALLDEGVPPDAAQVEVDDKKMLIRWIPREPTPEEKAPPPTDKKPTARPKRKKAAKKKTVKRKAAPKKR